MEMERLRSELERLFDFEELLTLSSRLLGFEPDEIGGTGGKVSFVRALTTHCATEGAVEALCDAVCNAKPDADPALLQVGRVGLSESNELSAGDVLGGYAIEQKLGEGAQGSCYLAERGGESFRVKVLHPETQRDVRGVHRFLTFCRMLARVKHPALPVGLRVASSDGHNYVVHRWLEGETLAAQLARTGALPANEMQLIMTRVAEALGALHGAGLCHGDVKPENVLVGTAEDRPSVLLLDAGTDLLRTRRARHANVPMVSLAAPATIAPERLQGAPRKPSADVYAVGATCYELVSGRAPFAGKNDLESTLNHLHLEPPPPSQTAPAGWLSAAQDELILRLLRSADERPQNGDELAQEFETLSGAISSDTPLSEQDVESLIAQLTAAPADTEVARRLEAAAFGPLRARICAAFVAAAEQLDGDESSVKAVLLLRAARGLASTHDWPGAEKAYAALVELEGARSAHWEALDEVRHRLGKHDEVIESLLGRLEGLADATQRAAIMARIGDIYARQVGDPAQAVVALSQALCESPEHPEVARRIEEVAGADPALWSEVLSTCSEASDDEEMAADERLALLVRLGTWYAERISDAQKAVSRFQTALRIRPDHAPALEGVSRIYRSTSMWKPLEELLTQRANAAAPSDARQLRTQAAEILERHLNDPDGARQLYEQVLRDDPSDRAVGLALRRIYEAGDDVDQLVPLLQRQIDEEQGAPRHAALCRLGDVYREHLEDADKARECFETVLAEDPAHVEAREKLDEALGRAGRYEELLASLHQQVNDCPIPRRQVVLWEQIARLYEEEFLSHADAASVLENVLSLDPGRVPAMVRLERVYRTLERWPELANLFQRHAEQLSDASERAAILTQRARMLAEQVGDLPEAIAAHEQVAHLIPDRIEPLEAIADLHEALGNVDEAIQSLQNVADHSSDADAKIRCFLRVARLLEGRGASDESLEWYRRVLALEPTHAKASHALRLAYETRGDTAGMVDLLIHDRDRAEGALEKARLSAEVARIELEHRNDPEAAEEAARQALTFDPNNVEAAKLLGGVTLAAGRHADAMEAYESVLPRLESLPDGEAVVVLSSYLDAADGSPTRTPEVMLRYALRLVELAPEDPRALARAARLSFEHGAPEQTIHLYQELLERQGQSLTDSSRAVALFRLGETERATNNVEQGVVHLSAAMDLDPESVETLEALASAYEAKEDYARLSEVKLKLVDLVDDARKAELYAELGELALDELSSPEKALEHFKAAVETQPDNRRVLIRLMQVHTQQESWEELVTVVDKLASFVDDPQQKCKYLVTAAMVSARQLQRKQQAVEYYQRVLALDPEHEKALSECVVLQIELGDGPGAEQALQSRLQLAQQRSDEAAQLEMLDALFALYQSTPSKLDAAIEVVDQALKLQPDEPLHAERLKELLERDPRHVDRAIELHIATLRQRPDDERSYRSLRRLHTDARRADAAWCLCQVLNLLRLADPEEARFFERHRTSEPAPAQASLTSEDWANYVIHPSADARLTEIFALLEPVVLTVRGQPLEQLGYDPQLALDLSQHPYPLGHMLSFAAGVMGVSAPPTFENHHEPGGLLYLNSTPPGIVMGVSAMQQLPAQTAAFIAARQLANYRPGFLLRHVLSTLPVLKAWLFAAFRSCSPTFPVASELEGPVLEAKAAIEAHLAPASRDRLVEVVSKLLQDSPSIDLKAWVAGVDLTADRVGFIVSNDLRSVADIIKTVVDPSGPGRDRRLHEIILYAIDTQFFAVRARLGIALKSLV